MQAGSRAMWAAGAAIVVSAGLTACGGGGSSNQGTPVFPVAQAPSIGTQPTDASVLLGGTATFSVVASGPDITYQWKKNGSDIAGATSSSYTTAATTTADDGTQYAVTITNVGGSVTSATAKLKLKLSSDQQAFESLIVAPGTGSYSLRWNLNYSGGEISGTNYAISDYALLPASPLTHGPQTSVQSAPRNLAANLALMTPTPDRVLVQGVILLVPASGGSVKATYVGSQVRIDNLAADNTTVANSVMRSNYSSTSLTGTMGTTPSELAHYFNSFFSNPTVLNAAGAWATGSGYIKFSETNLGDRYKVFDCKAATLTAAVSACATNTTLNTLLSSGFTSNSDGTTYHLSDGTVSTVGGVTVWVATAPRPQSATLSTTVEYRIYFELGGNVYTGALIKDGAAIGGSYYVSNPNGATATDRLTFLPYVIRLNKAAHDSIAAASQL